MTCTSSLSRNGGEVEIRNLMASDKTGIGLLNEKSLHASIKARLARPGDHLEVRVDGFIVDIVRDDLLIEIQTKNFSAIREKLRRLVSSHPLRLVYPIAQVKWIVRLAASGDEVISRRRSPKRGKLTDLFGELVRIPDLIRHENFTLEVLLIEAEEIRRDDGMGSWRRKGVSILDRRLLGIVERATFEGTGDFLTLLPDDLRQPFSNRSLSEQGRIPIRTTRQMTYCLKKMGAIEEVGKIGNELLFEVAT